MSELMMFIEMIARFIAIMALFAVPTMLIAMLLHGIKIEKQRRQRIAEQMSRLQRTQQRRRD